LHKGLLELIIESGRHLVIRPVVGVLLKSVSGTKINTVLQYLLAGYFSPTFSAGITSSERAVLRKEYDLVATLHSQPNTLQMLAIYSHQNDFESKSLFTFQKKVNDVLALKNG
jgi:hypothetical protein